MTEQEKKLKELEHFIRIVSSDLTEAYGKIAVLEGRVDVLETKVFHLQVEDAAKDMPNFGGKNDV